MNSLGDTPPMDARIALARRRKGVAIYFLILGLFAGIPGLYVSWVLLYNAQLQYDAHSSGYDYNPTLKAEIVFEADANYWFSISFGIQILLGFLLLPGYCCFLEKQPDMPGPRNRVWILSIIYNGVLIFLYFIQLCLVILQDQLHPGFNPDFDPGFPLFLIPPILLILLLPVLGGYLSFLCLDHVQKEEPRPNPAFLVYQAVRKNSKRLAVTLSILLLGALGGLGWYYGFEKPAEDARAAKALMIARQDCLERQKQAEAQDAEALRLQNLSGQRTPQVGKTWVNSLGLRFAPAGTDGVLFCVYEVRVKDYQQFATATPQNWPKPGFVQTENDPAVNMSWDQARAFCEWLTQKEQKAGILESNQYYRFPKNEEWNLAVGSGSPFEATDGFAYTSPAPVGSFGANQYGLYDMGSKLCRWLDGASGSFIGVNPTFRPDDIGLRLVLVVSP